MPRERLDAESPGVEASLRRLSMLYADAVDRRSVERLVLAFAADAVLEVCFPPDPSTPVARLEGHQEIAGIIEGLRRWASTVHEVRSARYVLIDAANAEGDVECVAHHVTHTPEGTKDRIMSIRHRDAYRRIGETWVIATRRAIVLEDDTVPLALPDVRFTGSGDAEGL